MTALRDRAYKKATNIDWAHKGGAWPHRISKKWYHNHRVLSLSLSLPLKYEDIAGRQPSTSQEKSSQWEANFPGSRTVT